MFIIVEKYCLVKQFANTTTNELLKYSGGNAKKLTTDFGPNGLVFDLSF